MSIDRASDNPFPSILLVEGDPEDLAANPASGQRRLAAGTDHQLYLVDDSGVKHSVAGSGLSDPMTTRGDLIIRNASNVTARLPIGSAAKVLTSDGTDVSWQTPAGGSYSGCSVSGTSTAISAGTYAALAFGATDTYDTDAYHDPSSNNTRLIAPTTAKYHLTCLVQFPASDTDRRIAYRINGGTDIIMVRLYQNDAGASYYVNASEQFALTAGDYVEVRPFSSVGGTVTNYRAQLSRLA